MNLVDSLMRLSQHVVVLRFLDNGGGQSARPARGEPVK